MKRIFCIAAAISCILMSCSKPLIIRETEYKTDTVRVAIPGKADTIKYYVSNNILEAEDDNIKIQVDTVVKKIYYGIKGDTIYVPVIDTINKYIYKEAEESSAWKNIKIIGFIILGILALVFIIKVT